MARPQHSRLPPERAHLVLPRTSRRQHRCRAAPPAGRPAGAACLVCANWATWRRRRALSTRPATACAGGPARLRAPQVRGPPPAATFAGARGGRPTRGAGAGRAPAGVFFNKHLSTFTRRSHATQPLRSNVSPEHIPEYSWKYSRAAVDESCHRNNFYTTRGNSEITSRCTTAAVRAPGSCEWPKDSIWRHSRWWAAGRTVPCGRRGATSSWAAASQRAAGSALAKRRR